MVMNIMENTRAPRPTFKCQQCDSAFKFKSKLERHTLVHTKVKNYICKFCNISFSLPYNLKVHLRIHQGLRPYKCFFPGCGKSFTQSNNLTVHKKIHKVLPILTSFKMEELDLEKNMSEII